MPEIVGIFGSKGDALAAVDELYELGYGDTEIGFLDRMSGEGGSLSPIAAGGVAGGIHRAGTDDEIGSLFRESIETGSAMLTVSAIEGDETDVTKVMHASGALRVNSYRDETGRDETGQIE